MSSFNFSSNFIARIEKIFLPVITILLFTGTLLQAQSNRPGYGRITGYIVYPVLNEGVSKNWTSLRKLPDATVQLVTGKDTLYAVSGMDGKFSFKKIPV